MRHLDERETAKQLVHTLLSQHGQATLLPVTYLPPKLLDRVRTYATAMGYALEVTHTSDSGQIIHLVPAAGVDSGKRANTQDSG